MKKNYDDTDDVDDIYEDFSDDDIYGEDLEEDSDTLIGTDDEESEKEEKEEKKEVKESKQKSKKVKKKVEKVDDEEEDEEEGDEGDDEDDEDDYGYEDGDGRTKIIIIAIVIAVAIAAASIVTYNHLKTDSEPATETTEETQNDVGEDEDESSDEEEYDETEYDEEDEEEYDEREYDEEDEGDDESYLAEPTATPKPLPTATPAVTEEDAAYAYEDDYDDYYDEYEEDDSYGEYDSTQVADTIFIGDSRFRAMANVATDQTDSWECSSSGDYTWMIDTAFEDVDPIVGEGTDVFISMGINDLNNYSSYASSINSQATEWISRGASVYFVSVGPVSESSEILNQDICNFNTYMYQNLTIPFIDAYNHLVSSGFETTDGQSYTDATSLSVYNYINSLF